MINRFTVNTTINQRPVPSSEQLKRINEELKSRNLTRSDVISITHDFSVIFVYFWDETTEQKANL